MQLNLSRARRGVAPAVAIALAAAGLTAGAATSAAAAAPALTVVAAVPTQTIVRAPGEPVYAGGLGHYAVAGPNPLEVRTKRSWTSPDVTATLRRADGTFAPIAVETDVKELSDFFYVTVTDARGRVVARQHRSFCPSNGDTRRARPDAPAHSPYPEACGYHPFTLGSVLGIQAGWQVPVYGWEGLDLDVPDGTYTLKTTVQPWWRTAFGIKVAQGSATSKIVVRTDASFAPGAARTAATGHEHHHAAAATGGVSPQAQAREEARVRALGHARTPAAAPPRTTVTRQAAAALDGPKPDLRSAPAYGMVLDTESRPGKTFLQFSATVWNAGPSPLVVDGFRRPGTELMDAYQYFFDAAGTQVGSAPAGTMEWDPRAGHEHWHFTAFASYRLLSADRSRTIRSGKEAFCLVPTDPINLTVAGANWKPASTDLSTACGDVDALSIRETVDAGHGDTYSQDLPGQSFDVSTVPNGTYYVEVKGNPDGKLVEASSTNNVSLRRVVIGGTPGGQRTLRVPPYHAIDAP